MEWSTDIDDPKDQHRHVNHLYGLHPGSTITHMATAQAAEILKILTGVGTPLIARLLVIDTLTASANVLSL